MIGVTEAMLQSLEAHLAKDFPLNAPVGVSKPSELVNKIQVGWAEQMDRMVPPLIEIDAPIDSDRAGRFPHVLAQRRIDEAGNPSVDPNDEDFIWTVEVASVVTPIELRVTANSKAERAAIDLAVSISLLGDYDEGGGLVVSDPNANYFNQGFTFRSLGAPRYFDSSSTAGREDYISLREVEAAGCEIFEYRAPSFKDLRMLLKVVEAGGDFDLVPAEPAITIFDPTTP